MINWLRVLNVFVWIVVVVGGPFLTLVIRDIAVAQLPQIFLDYLNGLFLMSVTAVVIVVLLGSLQALLERLFAER